MIWKKRDDKKSCRKSWLGLSSVNIYTSGRFLAVTVTLISTLKPKNKDVPDGVGIVRWFDVGLT